MSKLFIIVQDRANTGKTTALNVTKSRIEQRLQAKGRRYVYDLLCQQGQDFRGLFTYGDVRIGISSAGDYAESVDEGLKALAPICDITIFATRSRRSTVEKAKSIINGAYPGSDVVWLTKEHLTDITHTWTAGTLPGIISVMAQHTAESIIAIIDILRPGIL